MGHISHSVILDAQQYFSISENYFFLTVAFLKIQYIILILFITYNILSRKYKFQCENSDVDLFVWDRVTIQLFGIPLSIILKSGLKTSINNG